LFAPQLKRHYCENFKKKLENWDLQQRSTEEGKLCCLLISVLESLTKTAHLNMAWAHSSHQGNGRETTTPVSSIADEHAACAVYSLSLRCQEGVFLNNPMESN